MTFDPGAGHPIPSPDEGAGGRPDASTGSLPDDQPPSPGPSPFAGLSASPRSIVGGALDLVVRAGTDLRHASFYAGVLALITIGPFALIAVAAVLVSGDDVSIAQLLGAAETPFGVATLLAAVGLIVLYVESDAMSAAILGARLAGRPIAARQALRRSRRTFWRIVRATILVGLPLAIAQNVVGGAIAGGQEVVALPAGIVVRTLLGAPVAYFLAGIVLGDVGARTSIARSFGLFRARPANAVVVGAYAAAAGLLPVLAIGAGLDIVVRALLALGVAGETAPTVLDPVAIAAVLGATLVVVFALGTLIFTVEALTVSAQVFAFLALTHAAPGLRAIHSEEGVSPVRWLSGPARIALGLAIAASLAGVSAVLR